MLIRVTVLRRAFAMKFSGLAVVSVLLALCAPAAASAAQDYEIAANDGYGLSDCLAAGSECGQAVADAWCEAHGSRHALAFGLRSDVEGRATRVSATDEAYVIRCGD
jgi:hypothetical protein